MWLYGIATHQLGRYRRTERKQFKILERTSADPIAAEFTERSDTRVDMGRELVWVEPGLEPEAPARRTTYTTTVVYSDYGHRFKVLHP